jgi:hypothetical protein
MGQVNPTRKERMVIREKTKRGVGRRIICFGVCLAAALAAVVGAGGKGEAFEIKTGNEDVAIHWDNTFRYTLAQRLKGQSQQILNSVNNDDGDRNFDVGLVSSRLDLLSELDVAYKEKYGVRVSGAGWYDPIYRSKLDNTSVATSNHLVNGHQAVGLNSYTERLYGGPSGELLDAFAFAKFEAGEVPISVRAGRHTIFWGEAFFPYAGINGISYGQSPIDMAKAIAMPGVELKEVFRPLNQVSITVQPTKEFTLAGQYYLQWEENRFPEAGSYLGGIDMLLNSGEVTNLGVIPPLGPNPVLIPHAGDRKPRQAGDWGIMARWSPEELKGTIGLHYRNFSDKMPQILSDFAPGGPPLPLNYRLAYGSNISLYGLSFAKQILGVSVGSEISYRSNMPLASQWFAPAGARGETLHGVLNFLSVLSPTPLFDSATAIVEFSYGRWLRVTDNAQFFNGRDGYSGLDRPTRDNSTVAISFAPQWNQVLPGMDLTMPLSFATGMHGVSATGGGAVDNGLYSAGLSLDIFAKYKVDLTYAAFFGTVRPDANGQIMAPGNAGPNQGAADIFGLLRDRDLLSLTLKATF